MLFDSRNLIRIFGIVVLLLGVMMSAAHAEDDDDDERVPPAKNALWQNECGSCHVAFPPRLLPAASWRAVMSGLDKHFGSDASLDAASAREIGAFLEKNAGSRSVATVRANRYCASPKPAGSSANMTKCRIAPGRTRR